MPQFVFKILTYKKPGTYQWVRPPTGLGAGPLGSTYFGTLVTCIGAGSGGASGIASNRSQVAVTIGGSGGNGGAYAQGLFLTLPPLRDVIVGRGTLGAPAGTCPGTGIQLTAQVNSSNAGDSFFGDDGQSQDYLSSHGGQTSNNGVGGVANAGSHATNLVANRGGTQLPLDPDGAYFQTSTGPGISPSGLPSWNTTGNNAGGGGGSVNLNRFGGIGGGVGGVGGSVNYVGGGSGQSETTTPAQQGTFPGAGGGAAGSNFAGAGEAACTVLGGLNTTGGYGANALPNTGAAGGGGGASTTRCSAGGGVITSGGGGNGSHGFVQTVDIFTFPAFGNVTYWDWSKSTFFHMMNMARPISLTGRYQS